MSSFTDKVQLKAIVLSFVAYLVLSVVASVVLVQAWLPSGVSPEDAAKLAESAPALVTGELIIGTVLGIAAGWLCCHLSGATGLRNSLVLGIVFAAYAVVGIVMHSSAPLWKHVIHLLAPIPVSLFGGYLRLRAARAPGPSHA